MSIARTVAEVLNDHVALDGPHVPENVSVPLLKVHS